MIALTHKRDASAINAKYRGINKKERDKELLESYRNFLNNPNNKIEFNSTYWKTAKSQLKKETFGKCAYCESNTDVVAHGDVEHFRPKSVYWWLAYTYDNYLFACQICNQTYKGDNFPIKSTQIPAPKITKQSTDTQIEKLCGQISPDPIDTDSNFTLQKYLSQHKAEKAYLLNPYLDNPSTYFKYEFDDHLEEVKIVPTKPQYAEYIKAAEEYYGINRIELKNLRYSVFSIFRIFKIAYKELTNQATKREIEEQLKKMLSDKYIYSGMNRFFDKIL